MLSRSPSLLFRVRTSEVSMPSQEPATTEGRTVMAGGGFVSGESHPAIGYGGQGSRHVVFGERGETAEVNWARALLQSVAGLEDDEHGEDTPDRFVAMLREMTTPEPIKWK